MDDFQFHDLAEAGRKLGEKLASQNYQDPVVLALPRGGVAVGFEVAKLLGCSLDIWVVRKIGAPGNPEFGIGAVAEGAMMVFDQSSLDMLGLTPGDLQETINDQTIELERRVALYRGNRHAPSVAGKTVIVVDDGLATGITAQAVVQSIKLQKLQKLILAVPVCSIEAAQRLRTMVDQLVCLHIPSVFNAVGEWYEDFRQLSDADVVRLLEQAHREINPLKRST